MLQQAHEQGHDVGAATRALVAEKPLGDLDHPFRCSSWGDAELERNERIVERFGL